MLKLRLEGPNNQIQSFMYELEHNSSIELHESEENCEIKNGEVVSYSQCAINHTPRSRVEIIEMETVDGLVIRLPLLDVIRVKITDEMQIVSGKSYDIFADNKKGHCTWPK
ncbi:hypothetical protein [Baia soyae]|uniref:Uncharacterized protein n=1 Tax=Baia soyae TaxID=1544746 RepID=A0A4R2RZS2_9BACL|nr:hypothetical protein [Baia soyae]TCP70587.1 hypothetical protein EDD57_10127 [Baia soyae]